MARARRTRRSPPPRSAATSRCCSTTIFTIFRCRGRWRSIIWPSMSPASATSIISTTCRPRCSANPVTISRTGYTGERGYEIFCRAQDATEIWDGSSAEGKDMGIVPTAFTALDLLRVESYLLFYPYDNSQMFPFAERGGQAIRFGSWGSTSRSAPRRPASAAPRRITPRGARSGSGSTVSSFSRIRRRRPARSSMRAIARSAW